ncbi:MAG: anion permease [Lachnospiraceae bacterium]|nr:anion permease [Lachnospiraceae bacterium]
MKGKVIAYCKKETVQVIAGVLALLSCFLVPPSAAYLEYVNFNVLILLFCLMSVVAGMQQIGVFDVLCGWLLHKVHSLRGLMVLLCGLSFFLSMFLTNDVTLVTVVPFTIMVFGATASGALMRILLLETLAANLGSMLTPFGNPQNLFLYATYGFGLREFLTLMAPYTILSLILLLLTSIIWGKGTHPVHHEKKKTSERNMKIDNRKLVIYILLFGLSVLSVARLLDVRILLVVTLVVIGGVDWHLFGKVDYALLLTFLFFFVFVGNMGQVQSVRDFFANSLEGREVLTAVLASQIISNVPAAVLLAQFTDAGKELVIGTNLGGLGTLIASMASLITYKFYAKLSGSDKGKYLLWFTAVNVVFLLVLIAFSLQKI